MIGSNTCWKCGREYDAGSKRLRAYGKSEEKVICLDCSNVATQQRKIKGKWPDEDFLAMTEQDQQAYMRSMATCLGKDWAEKMKDAELKFFEKRKQQEKHYAEEGEFLPLSVWSTRGFNARDIEANSAAADVTYHPVLGKVYRVSIMSSGSGGREITENVLSSKDADQRKIKRTVSDVSEKSLERRRSKKAKKEDAKQRDEDKERAEKQKTKGKETKKISTTASKVVEMMEIRLNAIRTHQTEENELEDVPANLKVMAKTALDVADGYLKEAKDALKNPNKATACVDPKAAKNALLAAEKKDKALTTAAAAISKVLTIQIYPRQQNLTYTFYKFDYVHVGFMQRINLMQQVKARYLDIS